MPTSGEIVEASLVEAFAAFGANSSFKVNREYDHVRTRAAVDIPFLNNVFGFPQSSLAARRRIEQLAKSFSVGGLGSIWWFRTSSEAPPELLHAFPEYGFSFFTKVPGMLMGHHVPPVVPPDLEIIEVTSDSLMRDWFSTWSSVFDPTFQVSAYYASLFEACGQYRNPAFRFLLGKVNGETVTCISAYDDGRALGLFNGATREGFRRRGYGAAILSHCIDRFRRHPTFPVYLVASSQGFSVWQSLGFETVCDFHQFYLPPVSPLTTSRGSFHFIKALTDFMRRDVSGSP